MQPKFEYSENPPLFHHLFSRPFHVHLGPLTPKDQTRLPLQALPQIPRNVDHGLLPHRSRGPAQALRRVHARSIRVSDSSI
ncbi:hypothetical protein QJS04_geneDACA004224 [Acorus gramineus]|uniref:Uncharacterized protein n=1 Tax=Acorus gramineus TaxID=55184 RepID=A0AAV9B268_ACOGR|nr:hypothetical protein QJS04_geneDACA004224 [Acorus gramineus]